MYTRQEENSFWRFFMENRLEYTPVYKDLIHERPTQIWDCPKTPF